MAVAAWEKIYDTALKAAESTSKVYLNAYRASRKAHYQNSAVYKTLTPEQLQDGARHKRDGALYTK
jgi:predicted Zn-dependent protease